LEGRGKWDGKAIKRGQKGYREGGESRNRKRREGGAPKFVEEGNNNHRGKALKLMDLRGGEKRL